MKTRLHYMKKLILATLLVILTASVALAEQKLIFVQISTDEPNRVFTVPEVEQLLAKGWVIKSYHLSGGEQYRGFKTNVAILLEKN